MVAHGCNAAFDMARSDWSNAMALWAAERPMDVEARMLEQARLLKAANQDAHVWVYRNLVKAESCFAEVQDKLSDPRFDGWFLKFANGSKYFDPRCYDHAAGWKLAAAEAHCDCGAVQCGTYLWDHRNRSLRKWLGTVHVAGPTGVESPFIDGLYAFLHALPRVALIQLVQQPSA